MEWIITYTNSAYHDEDLIECTGVNPSFIAWPVDCAGLVWFDDQFRCDNSIG